MIILIFGLLIGVECKFTEIIQTTKGPVQGEILKTIVESVEYSSFKGIPYAEPPIGHLRFKPPVEKKPWRNTLRTTTEGANCVQKDFVYHNYTGSENCLYLNVYTPEINFNGIKNRLKAVMVWIHGGTFKSGYGNSSLYGPDFFIEENVILVTFNYRLGPLGFLSLNHPHAIGNAGLKDQNLVLKWVNDNIINFGGDPAKVTLFGQSAGGVAVDLHTLSDMSKGLFQRSISMSASPLCPWSFSTSEDAEKQAFVLGKKLGVSTTSKDKLLKILYETPAIELMQITEQLGSLSTPFKPTIEKDKIAENEQKFLTECSYKSYKRGDFIKIPHITGFTKHETLLFTRSLNSIMDLLQTTMDYVKSIPSASPIPIPFLNTITSLISKGVMTFKKEVIMRIVEVSYSQRHRFQTKIYAEKNNYPIYYYHFSYETERSIHKLLYNISLNGVAHGDDFGYLFHMTVTDLPLDSSDQTFITRKRVVRMWTNFAKYGNPTPESETDNLLQGIKWPASGRSGLHLDIGENLSIGGRPAGTEVQLYQLLNDFVLPLQTGCTTNTLSAVTNLLKKPFTSIINAIG